LTRVVVLNSPELRSGLQKAYRCLAAGLTEAEWRALRGVVTILEAAAARQSGEWLRDTLADSGLPKPVAWVIEKRLKGREFTEDELTAEIEAARQGCPGPKTEESKQV